MILTSPPYWGLRNYGIDEQLGLEPTLAEYYAKLLKITAELKRVLKPTGVMFWNHGDSYGGNQGRGIGKGNEHTQMVPQKSTSPKCLTMQNERLIIKMVDEQGWILRNRIIWHKQNGMPSSVQDRFTNKYEPVYMLTRNKKYWFDLDAVRVSHTTNENRPVGVVRMRTYGYKEKYPYAIQPRNKEYVEVRNMPDIKIFSEWLNNWRKEKKHSIDSIEQIMDSQAVHHWFNGESYPSVKDWKKFKKLYAPPTDYDKPLLNISKKPAGKQNNPSGKNPGDLWTINTQPFPEAHFAVFPEKLCEKPILAGCPAEVCKHCGMARVRITKTEYDVLRKSKIQDQPKVKAQIEQGANPNLSGFKFAVGKAKHETISWTDCPCIDKDKYEPGIVLDPFGGSGTVSMVAEKLGRSSILIDINPEYCEMAYKRLQPLVRQLRMDRELSTIEKIGF